jgi:hypothetical protein
MGTDPHLGMQEVPFQRWPNPQALNEYAQFGAEDLGELGWPGQPLSECAWKLATTWSSKGKNCAKVPRSGHRGALQTVGVPLWNFLPLNQQQLAYAFSFRPIDLESLE